MLLPSNEHRTYNTEHIPRGINIFLDKKSGQLK